MQLEQTSKNGTCSNFSQLSMPFDASSSLNYDPESVITSQKVIEFCYESALSLTHLFNGQSFILK